MCTLPFPMIAMGVLCLTSVSSLVALWLHRHRGWMLSIPAVILLALALMLSAGWVTAKKRGFMVKQGSRAWCGEVMETNL